MDQTSWDVMKSFIEQKNKTKTVEYYKDLRDTSMLFVLLSKYFIDREQAMKIFNLNQDVRLALVDPALKILFNEM